MRKRTDTPETGTVLRLETLNGKSVGDGPRPEFGDLGVRLYRELVAARSMGQKAQLLIFRIRSFETLVDTFGADFGRAAENAVMAQLRGKLRKREPVQKIKAGEFGIVGRGIQSVNALNAMAARMVEGGTGHYEINNIACRLNIDIGAAACPEDSEDPGELLRFARFALGEQTAEQANYRSFSRERFARQKNTFWIEAEMEQALRESRFSLMYQPQYAINSGEIAGIEALARMRTRDGREIAPAEFIPVAEDNGFIIPLGRWVIEEACRQLAAWRRAGCAVPRMSINLSPKQLHDPELIDLIKRAIRRHDLHFGDIEMEITERCLVDECPVVAERLHAMRALGVRVAIDDFGTGYSSFAYIAGQPLDMIKLDRSFLARAGTDVRTGRVVAGMIQLANELGMDLLAEGVENEDQARFLREQGCELAQGFALARPQEPERIVDLFLTGVANAEA